NMSNGLARFFDWLRFTSPDFWRVTAAGESKAGPRPRRAAPLLPPARLSLMQQGRRRSSPSPVACALLVLLLSLPTPCSSQADKVTNAVWKDENTQDLKINGLVSWTPPADVTGFTHYQVQIAFDRLNTCGVDLYDVSPGEYGADGIPVGTNQLQVYVPTGRGLGSACNKPARWILVLPRSGNSLDLSRAAIIPLYDLGPTVPALLELDSFSFSDTDPAPGQVGGTVEWALKYPDMDTAYIEYYSVYLASDPNGAQQVSVGQVLRGTNQLVIPSGTSQTENSCGCVLMYPKNAIGLSASPAGHFCFESDGVTYTTTTATSTSTVTMTATVTTLDPSQVVVTNLLFDDTNADAMLLAGTLSWDPPGNSAQ
ncbi:unnamed protein product, partial [Polarella glacialis]